MAHLARREECGPLRLRKLQALALDCRIPSRTSPSPYTLRFAGTDGGARTKLRFLSPAPARWAARQASEGGRKVARRRT